MQREFERGRAAGRAEMRSVAASHGGNGVGQGVNGYGWLAIAKHLQAHASQMPTTFEREFCGSIAAQLRHPPSAKQAAVLRSAGVSYEPRTAHLPPAAVKGPREALQDAGAARIGQCS